jgi:hypothetical protein
VTGKMENRFSASDVFESRNLKIHASSKGWTLFNYSNEKSMRLSYVPHFFLRRFLYNVISCLCVRWQLSWRQFLWNLFATAPSLTLYPGATREFVVLASISIAEFWTPVIGWQLWRRHMAVPRVCRFGENYDESD